MITAVDTNVFIDVLEPDPRYGSPSRDTLARCPVVACDVVWAEVATAYGEKQTELLAALEILRIDYCEVSQETALQAARHWHTYRRRGATRQRIAADFIMGAHALVQCDRLLTRDRGAFRGCFAGLTELDPADDSEDDAGTSCDRAMADDAHYAFGCCGHGFQLGPVAGSLVANLVSTGSSNLPIEPFRTGPYHSAMESDK